MQLRVAALQIKVQTDRRRRRTVNTIANPGPPALSKIAFWLGCSHRCGLDAGLWRRSERRLRRSGVRIMHSVVLNERGERSITDVDTHTALGARQMPCARVVCASATHVSGCTGTWTGISIRAENDVQNRSNARRSAANLGFVAQKRPTRKTRSG